MKTLKFAVLPGDGIGPEVMEVALDVLENTGEKFGFDLDYDHACLLYTSPSPRD